MPDSRDESIEDRRYDPDPRQHDGATQDGPEPADLNEGTADGPLTAVLLAVGVDPVGSTRHVIGGQLERVEMG